MNFRQQYTNKHTCFSFVACLTLLFWLTACATQARKEVAAIQATVTAEFAIAIAQQTRDAESLSGTATANAQDLQRRLAEQNATATSEAAIMQTRNAEQAGGLSIQATQTSVANAATAATFVAQATVYAISLQATQSAQATADALANQCRDITLYAFEISPQPVLQPIPVATYVLGDWPVPQISAAWVITNTGECPMNNIQLLIGDRTFRPDLRRAEDSVAIQNLEPGGVARLIIDSKQQFNNAPNPFSQVINWRWTVVVDNPVTGAQFELASRQHPELVLTRSGWIIAVTPTSMPTPTPFFTTPTPITRP